VAIADLVGRTEIFGEFLVVLQEFLDHALGRERPLVTIMQALVTRDVADRAKGIAPEFASPLRDGIGHRKQLLTVLIEQEMVVAEMASRHVPVEVLRLHVKRESVCQ
jgi:hypothetical protein